MNASRQPQAALNELGVAAIVEGVRAGTFSATEVLESCLQRIRHRDSALNAWSAVSGEEVLRAAEAIEAGSPLAGVPFGVKDVLDTADLPTEMGSEAYRGHQPRFDAGVVGQLRLAGGLMLGKTATAEFAGIHPPRTVNPLDPAHTPGGSSSGSAAAVADFMVPFALGTQTGGSVLRPAAFCGVVGFKPTFGAYTSAGMKPAAHSFDTIGLLARSVRDVALVHSVLMSTTIAEIPEAGRLRIGFFRSHLWPEVDDETRAIVESAARALGRAGAKLSEVAPPSGFDRINEYRAIINSFERARGLASEWERTRPALSNASAATCERGFAITGERYFEARRKVDEFRQRFHTILRDYDFLVTPVTPGAAPEGLGSTGDPRLQELWTMLHLPSIGIPAGRSRNGLPLGVQMVGRAYEDSILLAAAEWAGKIIGEAV